MRAVRRQDFSYDLPEELIAQSPLAERSASRLLVLDGASGAIADRMMTDLPGYLRAGDLLVFNDTRVVAARVVGAKPSGGRVEIFLERAGSGREALVQLRASKPIREGLEITTAGGVVRVLGREGELWRIEVPDSCAAMPRAGTSPAVMGAGSEAQQSAGRSKPQRMLGASGPVGRPPAAGEAGEGDARGANEADSATSVSWAASAASRDATEPPYDALAFFEAWGEVPLPPYIHRAADAGDRERYQSIFAREKGAVAAPTASLHFDAGLLERLAERGVGCAFITLHVGAGTFQPLRTDNLDEHKMHAERVSVSRATWEAIQRTRGSGGRVIAVGTTVVRALESAALAIGIPPSGRADTAEARGATSRLAEAVAPAAREDQAAEGRAAERTMNRGAVKGYAMHAHGPGRAVEGGGPEGATERRGLERAMEGCGPESAMERHGPQQPMQGRRPEHALEGHGPGHAVEERHAEAQERSEITAWSGDTRLFIRPGFEFQVVDAMVTNFHLPESTLLMLVSAFAGRENVLAAYAHAVRERYRFFSYGDAMLVTPTNTTRGPATTSSTGTAKP
jgi:S-adenosylmethionine:tRNA ribosyltransferase-isomerase